MCFYSDISMRRYLTFLLAQTQNNQRQPLQKMGPIDAAKTKLKEVYKQIQFPQKLVQI